MRGAHIHGTRGRSRRPHHVAPERVIAGDEHARHATTTELALEGVVGAERGWKLRAEIDHLCVPASVITQSPLGLRQQLAEPIFHVHVGGRFYHLAAPSTAVFRRVMKSGMKRRYREPVCSGPCE